MSWLAAASARGCSSVEGDTLQEAADDLVGYVMQVVAIFWGIGPMYAECSPDPAAGLHLTGGELAETEGNRRDLLCEPNPLAA